MCGFHTGLMIALCVYVYRGFSGYVRGDKDPAVDIRHARSRGQYLTTQTDLCINLPDRLH